MSRPSTIDVLETLLDRQGQALKKAEQARLEGKAGKELYYRTIAQQAAMIYAWMRGDDARAAVTEYEQRQLEKVRDSVDEQMLQYRLAVARAAVEAA